MKMMAEEAKMKDELCRRLVSDCVSGGGERLVRVCQKGMSVFMWGGGVI